MITKMKKLTFLVYHKEYEAFLTRIQELGVLHVQATQEGSAEPTSELEEKLRQAAFSSFRRFPLRIPVWVTFGSNGKVTEFSIGKSSENAEKSG